jgi:DHA1 family bicyclomycin/chloramphenicol resistance-like MFS transporter
MTAVPEAPVSLRAPSFAALVLVTGVGPVSLDTYLPALPAMAISLHTSAAAVQLTVTGFIVGMALGQLVAGPLSDGHGRRPYLLGGTIAFTALSLTCAISPNVAVLVVARVLQGLVAGAGIACGRAVVSDYYRGEEAAVRFGTLTSLTRIGPVLAPAIGSLILTFGDWRTVFWVLTALGLTMFGAVVFGLLETLPAADRHHGGLRATRARIADLATDRRFMRTVVIGCLSTASFFAYIGGSSFVLQTVYGIDQHVYAWLFTVNAITLTFGYIGYRFTVARFGAPCLQAVGLGIATAGTFALFAVAAVGHAEIRSIAVPSAILAFMTIGIGFNTPSLMTIAQHTGDRARGTASALQGGGSFLAGAIVTPLTGLLGYHSLLPMASLMAGLMGASALFALCTRSERWIAPVTAVAVPA